MGERDFNLTSLSQRRILWIVLFLNIGLAVAFAITGWLGDSSALIANALDNASDGVVYVISLLALGRPPRWKRAAARVSGVMLMIFAVGVLLDAARRVLMGTEPIGYTMMTMALGAAIINAICLWLLKRVRKADVNLRAAQTFSANDFLSNAGILVAGAVVLWTGQAWPDLVVGVAVAAIAIKGGLEIWRDANCEAKLAKEA